MDSAFWWNFGLSLVIPILQTAIKDPAKRASIKKAALKIAALIQAAYANDPDFAATSPTMKAKIADAKASA